MSTSLSGLSTNFFPSAQNGFQTTLASTISSGAATVPLNSVAGYTNGQIGVFVVDPTDTTKKQTFTGVIDTAGVQVTSVVWTAGTNVGHAGGATVVDYATATHISMITKGITQSLNQDGSLIGSAVRTALGQVAQTGAGWTTLGNQPNTVTANGNRSYNLVFNAVDLTGTLSPGMRLMTSRTVAAPTKSTSLNGTTQYYSKTSPAGMTFTDDFTVSAWIKLTSYAAAESMIASRANGTQGWLFAVNASGQIYLSGANANLGNYSRVTSYQSVPLNKWVHVSANLDMSAFATNTDGGVTGSCITIDGINIPSQVTRAGTNPTALVQAGDLEIGAYNGATSPFPGKIAQVAIFSSKITNATMLTYFSQGLAGTETNLISAYSFNNSINDLNANANNLTANGSAVATNADSPFGGQAGGTISSTLDYGIITSASFSTNTTLVVQVPEGCTIPTSGGVSAVSYSTNKAPYGFPVNTDKWRILYSYRQQTATASNATFAAFTGMSFVVPIGAWSVGWQAGLYSISTTGVYWTLSSTSQTGLAATTSDLSLQALSQSPSAATVSMQVYLYSPASLSSANTYTMYTLGATTAAGILGSTTKCELFAECAYL